MKPILSHSLMAIVSVIVMTAMGEGALRLLAKGQGVAEDAPDSRLDRPCIHPSAGECWPPSEGATIERRDPQGNPFKLRINSTGQRGAELEDPIPSQRRVLFLGDSFTMSSYLRQETTFVDAVGRRFVGRPKVLTINGGVDGYGTYQQLAYYRYYGRPLMPDLVVLCFFMGNDWRDNMISTRQGRGLNPVLIPGSKRFERHDDRILRGSRQEVLPDPLNNLAIINPSRAWMAQLMRNSWLARLLGSRYYRLRARWTGEIGALDVDHQYYFYEIGFYQSRDDGYFATARDLTLASLDQLNRLVIEDGAELALVLLPSQYQVDRFQWLRMLEDLGVDEADLGPLDMEYPNKILKEFCRQQQIPLLDLYRTFVGSQDVSDLFLTAIGDGHLSARGHALVAEQIFSFINNKSFRFSTPAVQHYRQGLYSKVKGDSVVAEKALLAACEVAANWSAPHDALGDLYVEQNHEKDAEVRYRSVVGLDPKRRNTWAKLARLLDKQGSQGGEEAWRKALELHPEWWPYYIGLLEHFQAEGNTAGVELMRSEISQVEQGPLSIRRYWWNEHISRGVLVVDWGGWAEAEAEFERAIRLLPGEPVGYYNLGCLYERINRPSLAIKAYEKALEVEAGFTPARDQLQAMGRTN